MTAPTGELRLPPDRDSWLGRALEQLPVRLCLWMTIVMAVLSKAGCNAGACHGNKNGKGGFKLSLRGQDPGEDYATLTRDMFARRVDAVDPDKSLVLLKPTTQLPHEGGLRFRPDSPEYATLRAWVAEGAPSGGGPVPVLRTLEVAPAP